MANILIPKHGEDIPADDVLREGEIGIAHVNGAYILYVGDKNGVANRVGFETPLSVENGGTGATTAVSARASLGLGPLATLSSIGLSSTYITGTLPISKGGTGKTSWTSGRLVYASSSTSLNQITNTNGALYTTGLTSVPKFGTLPIAQGGTGATSAEDARVNLGLGNLATLSTTPIANGGTGATTADNALANLGGLSLSGGTMVNTGANKGIISHPGNSSSWGKGRDNAFIRRPNATSSTGIYYPIISSKTVNGDWTMGTLSNNFYISYVTDTDYNEEKNSVAQQFWFGADGNFYTPAETKLIANGTLGANASGTVSGDFNGFIYKNLLILVRSVASSGNKYSSFVLPAIADNWGLYLPAPSDYYRVTATISGSGYSMSCVVQMDSNVSEAICWIYGTI